MVRTTWLIDGQGFADKIKCSGLPAEQQIKDCGAKIECPNCHYSINNTDVSEDWPGLPLVVKFDPTDVELLKHLADKCGVGDSEPHKFIELFIPTIQYEDGICYTLPEKLPGAKTDGSCVYFFHKIANAFTTGNRKRRRITNSDENSDIYRWHKSGKTKHVVENGVHKGWKEILVLDGAKVKPNKCSWVMHQYHLGTAENQQEGSFVVSKIFYQTNRNETSQVIPTTCRTQMSDPPRNETTPVSDFVSDDYAARFLVEDQENQKETCYPSHCAQLKWKTDYSGVLAGESQAVDLNGSDFLQCTERYGSATTSGDLISKNAGDLQPETVASSTQVCANASERDGWRTASYSGMLAGEPQAVDLNVSDFHQWTERYGSATTSGDLIPKNAGDLQPETQVGANASDAANQGDANFDIDDFDFLDFSQDMSWLRFSPDKAGGNIEGKEKETPKM